jgi:hypothetical protein
MAHIHDPHLVAVPLAIEHDPIIVYLAHRAGEAAPALREVLAAAAEAVPTPSPPVHTVAAHRAAATDPVLTSTIPTHKETL